MGQLVAGMEALGTDVDQRYILKDMKTPEKSAYFRTRSQSMNDVEVDSVGTENDKTQSGIRKYWSVVDKIAGRPGQAISSVITEQRNPSGLFGEDRVKPVIDFVTQHYKKNSGNLQNRQSQYTAGIKKVFSSIDVSDLKESRKGAWKNYQHFYEHGGELYTSGSGSKVGSLVTNLAGNTIQSSPTVLLGNILEGTVKLPALYPTTFLQGLAKGIWKGKGIFKIPELEALGLYGREYAGKENAPIWDKIGTLIELSDVPFKNALYYAGELKGGESEGLRAVQRGAFLPRFGDLPSVYYSTAGRNDVRFLSYTVNTWKLYADFGKGLLTGSGEGRLKSAYGLSVLTSLPFALGGLRGGIPEPIANMIGVFSPDTKEVIEESSTPLSGFVQVGGVNRIGIAYSIAERQLKKSWSNFEKGGAALQDQDTTKAAGYFTQATLGLLPFTKSPLGDAQLQKLMNLGLDIARDDLDEPLNERLQNDFLPKPR